jgi:hypothetical protein
MPDLLPATYGARLPTRLERQTAKAARQDAARIAHLTVTTERGMESALRLSVVEAQLARTNPDAEARIRVICDAGCMGIAAVVHDAGRAF